jgi:hypothetical protein
VDAGTAASSSVARFLLRRLFSLRGLLGLGSVSALPALGFFVPTTPITQLAAGQECPSEPRSMSGLGLHRTGWRQ